MDESNDNFEDEFDEWSDHELPDEYGSGDLSDETSIIECPQCGDSIYEESEQCPNCGEYIVAGAAGSMSNFTKIVIWLVIISLALPAIIVALNLL